jgi:hypothetical protein
MTYATAEARHGVGGLLASLADVLWVNDPIRVDWRSDYRALSYEVVDVPAGVAAGIDGYLASFGLRYAAFDFAVTPAGDWVFLEANPAGQWLWLELETGAPIAAAHADLLAKGAAR